MSYVDENGVLVFGKYKGSIVENVADDDPKYIRWMLDTLDLTRRERELLEENSTHYEDEEGGFDEREGDDSW